MGHKEDHTGEGEAGWAIRRITQGKGRLGGP